MPDLSTETVRSVVEDLHGGTATDVTPAGGKNAVYEASVEGRRVVLKIGTATPERVRAEPGILGVVRDRTRLPTPAVLGAGSDRVAPPCVLYERVPGRTVDDRPDLSTALLARLAETAGRHLAALHDVPSPDRFGPVVAEDGVLTVPDGTDDWPSLVAAAVDAKADALGERFADLAGQVRDYADAVADGGPAPGPSDPSVVHMDYRPANLVLRPDAARPVAAVLDWAGTAAAPAAYEVAHARALLAEWPELSEDDRTRLRRRFDAGYDAVGELPRVPDAYRVDARLRLVKHFEVATRALDGAATRERAGEHRRALDALLP